MSLVDPKFNFEFDVLSKGIHPVEVKETGIEEQKEGKTSGKRYWVRLVAVGGSEQGVSHIESFFGNTKNDFSLSKMAGLLYKLGVISKLGKVETDAFKTQDFENKWKNGLNGRKMGIKIRHRFADDDKDKDSPRSECEAYLTYDEALSKSVKGDTTGGSPSAPPPATDPAPPAPWS